MHNEKIHLIRIKRLLERQKQLLIRDKLPLEAGFSATGGDFQPLALNSVWGKPWQTGWFRISGSIPEDWSGKDYRLLFDCDGEACLLLDGVPYQGFTPKVDWYHKAAKNLLPLASICKPGEDFSLLIDASANDLFGAQKEEYRLRECALVTFDEGLYQRLLDISLLLDLAETLPEKTVRRQRLIYGLNKVCDAWNTDQEMVQAILAIFCPNRLMPARSPPSVLGTRISTWPGFGRFLKPAAKARAPSPTRCDCWSSIRTTFSELPRPSFTSG